MGCATSRAALALLPPWSEPWAWPRTKPTASGSNITHSKPNPVQNPGETEHDGVEAIHEELEAAGYEHARENAHGEDCGGPRSPCGPCRSTEEADEGKDGDGEREWGQTDARRA